MYKTSKKWKENIYENPICAINIYIDDILVNPDYILEFKKGGNIFEEEFCLGSTPSQYIEMKLYKDKMPKTPSKIKVEYGILINHALTVEEINVMMVGTLNGIPVKSLTKNNSSFEMIPIGIYNVDDYTDNDDNTITIKALDNMIKFEFSYDGKELIDKKNEATLLEVAQDICNKAGVELGSTSFLNSDKKVSVYDNTVTAREYISYIAEGAGGFAYIDREGKLCFREFYQDETEIPLGMFGEYKWGEEFKISKVSYEDGTRSFKPGDDTRNNLWINQENMYIVDEDQIQKIYEKIKGLVVNTFEGKTIIDPAVDIGDKIVIDGKNVIYQGEMSLEGRFIAQISSKIQIKQKEETTVKKESQKVVNRRVHSRIDQAEGKIEQLVEETSKNTQNIAKQEISINGIIQEVSKKVGNDEFSTKLQTDYESVQIAWNKISDYIKMMILNNNASLAILDKDKNVMMALDKEGQHFYKDNGNEFGEMGVQVVDDNNYIAFSIPTDYDRSIDDGMAWGVTTSLDGKFHPILYIKNFTMPPKNSGGCTGELQLDGCNLILGGENGCIISNGVKIVPEALGGISFLNDEDNVSLLTIINNSEIGQSIYMLDNISFYRNPAGSNSFKIGNDNNAYCLFTDEGHASCNDLYARNSITSVGTITSEDDMNTLKNFQANGNISANGNMYCTKIYANNVASDRRLKKNIKKSTIEALKIINKIQHVQYEMKKDNTYYDVGYIAQDMEKINSNFVMKREKTEEYEERYYINMLPILATATKAIQEQQEQIVLLQAKDKQKDELIKSLIQRIETLEKEVNK